MTRRTLAAMAVGLGINGAMAAPPTATAELTDATAAARIAQPVQPVQPVLQPDRLPIVRSVIAPPKPKVETNVQPGLDKLEKHERLTDVLRARARAGGTARVVAD